ncbi:Co2+/Mg2+ efflux protein ApaG [Altibacter sp.]|uniref:Co2+/Mg2+ efflux protein ApaG n=1 Tax=Altibacter sp. TaxID=2024823 RepID=UPI000C96FD36|nr:Co2+/Mg2+ efflux protein ApaG [Altibacter sp.]MAP54306.1 Co2+/Mg2+ efflux protein ApaG [Altibacter sp.]
MVQQVTQGIKVSVETSFEGTFYKNYKIYYAFGYTITIENQSKDVVQLTTRHWKIKDALNDLEVVEGEGVIGKKPVLQPGTSHSYSSGCLLLSPFGAMHGYYAMVNFSSTRKFRVAIPSFKLSAPFAMN